MPIFGAASRAAVVRVVCTSCGEVQARARGPQGTTYACRKCGKTIADAQGQDAEGRAAPVKRGKRT